MDGIILINKEKDWTSHDVVAKIKKLLKVKVGHTGTLDPNATGVLPLLLGNATKISKYLINHDKEYIAELQLGIKTDTADGEGKIIEEKPVNLKELINSVDLCLNIESFNNKNEESKNIENYLQKVLNQFVGKNLQKPPIYSAIKVNGKKLYEYARENKQIDVKPREIEIYKIELINFNSKENIITFKVSCSKGTYIRTLCENIAEKLNTCGYMKELQRTRVGKFKIENTITINELEKLIDLKENEIIYNNSETENILEKTSSNEKHKYYISIEELFSKHGKIELNTETLNKFLNGVKINNNREEGIYRIYRQNKFIGIGINTNGKLKRDVII